MPWACCPGYGPFVPSLFSKAIVKTAAAEKAVHGFQSFGLWPYNANKFTDEDFAAAAVTEEVDPARSLQGCPAADTRTNLERCISEKKDKRTRQNSARGRCPSASTH